MDGDDIDMLRERYPRGEYIIVRVAVKPEDADWLFDKAVWNDIDPSTTIQRAIHRLRLEEQKEENS